MYMFYAIPHKLLQAVAVVAGKLRTNEVTSLRGMTTREGFEQISKDWSKSFDDPRMKLLAFDPQDIQKVIPIHVKFLKDDDGIGYIYNSIFEKKMLVVN